MASLFAQSVAVIRMNIASIPERLLMSLATIMAVAVAVAVLLGFLSLSNGFRTMLDGSGAQDVAVVLRGGSSAEINSVITRDQARIVDAAPGVARRADGAPALSGELYVIVDGVRRSTGIEANMPLRGLGPEGLALRRTVRIAEGRMFAPGTNEIVVGKELLREFAGFELGRDIRFGASQWKVVGVFEAPGSVLESELWADASVVQSLFNRGSTVQSIRVKLTDPGQMKAFKDYIESDPRLNLEAKSEKDYFAGQAGGTAALIRFVGLPLGVIMAIGALAGALNTMYSSVSSRATEIATLRMIGFSGAAALFGTMAEALALSLIGAALAILIALLFFNGASASTLGEGFTQVVFQLKVSPGLVLQGLGLALAIGLIGGLFPGLKAARQKPQLALG
jgi:putative ABC transport system permease protein